MKYLATTVLLLHSASAYKLVKTIAGNGFFDNWSYYGHYDNLTNGDIVWVDQQTADSNPKLTYINDAGNAIVKVDDQSTVPYNEKRNSVRLTSNDKFNLGSLWIFDVVHVPVGCSVWPALWSKAIGPNLGKGGEIDIFEGVNLQQANQMALHTETGCTQADGVTQTGHTNVKACDNNSTSGAGCTVSDANENSYGQPFNAAGGGVWVTEFASTGINIWFYTRSAVPSGLDGDNLDTSTLGTPSASWPASSCNPSQYFQPQELVIDITLCGDWAGLPSILEATCPPLNGTNTCYTTYVLDSANYHDAYFEIKSVKLFADPSNTGAVSLAPSGTSTTTATPNGNGNTGAAVKGTSLAAWSLVVPLGLFYAFGF